MNRKSIAEDNLQKMLYFVSKLVVAAVLVYILLMLYLICYCSAIKSGFLACFFRCNRIFPTSHVS